MITRFLSLYLDPFVAVGGSRLITVAHWTPFGLGGRSGWLTACLSPDYLR